MDHSIGKIFHVEFFASCSDVTILEPVTFLDAINTGHQNIAPYIEFTFLVQERHDILLNYVGTRPTLCINIIFRNNLFDLLQRFHHLNPIASVGILPRFH